MMSLTSIRYPDLHRHRRLSTVQQAPLSVQHAHAWNPADSSPNISVLEEDKTTCHRRAVLNSTDCIRGRHSYTGGMHVWSITWSLLQRGPNAVVGVATADAPLQHEGHQPLIGANSESWGWDLSKNKAYHDIHNRGEERFPKLQSLGENFVAPEFFLVILDMNNGTLSFAANGVHLGIAFDGLRGKRLYPIVSTTWAHCQVTIRYLFNLRPRSCCTLVHFCRGPVYNPDALLFQRIREHMEEPGMPSHLELEHAWNPDDCSPHIIVANDDPFTFFRMPFAYSTDCIRGRQGYTYGLHIWTIFWSRSQRGPHAVVGVATAEAPLYSEGFQPLVGSNPHSWGWDLGQNKLYHDLPNNQVVTYPRNNFVMADFFAVILDMDEGTLSFVSADGFQGIAFRGLKGRKVYPVVCTVWPLSSVTMRYLGCLDPQPLSLLEMCRHKIKAQLGQPGLMKVDTLPIPALLKNYLTRDI